MKTFMFIVCLLFTGCESIGRGQGFSDVENVENEGSGAVK